MKISHGMNALFLFSLAIFSYASDISQSHDEKVISEKLIGYLHANVITVDLNKPTTIQSLQWISIAIEDYPKAILAVKARNVNTTNIETLLSLLTQAYYLDISNNDLIAEDAKIIARSNFLKKMEKLNISYNKIGSQGAMAIATSKKFTLNQLNLCDNEILIDSMDTIANSPRFKKLMYLDLSKNTIGNAGATAIANSPRLKQLRSLNLNETEMGDIGIMEILYKDNLKKLSEFFGNVQSEGKVSENAAHMARIQFEDCNW
jgi:hypothetical protein